MTDNKLIIKLKSTKFADLDILFRFQLYKEVKNLAAVRTKYQPNKTAYITKYTKLLNDPSINNQTIFINNIIVGSIAKFERDNDAEVTYLIDKNFWGQGIATIALKQFLTIEIARPIFGRTAFDNFASQRVLEKCDFKKIGKNTYFANERQSEIEELIYKFD
jgi:[ribosomal protein S5]-alanine N-acetyltransferase